jgi:DNA repair protein RecO (recombination protein O)
MSQFFRSDGIVFRNIKYAETSIICDIYTREKGLRSFIVSGIRTAKAGSRAAIYRPLNMVNIIAYDHEGEKLSRVKEISLRLHYQHINVHILTSAIAMFMLEICRNAIKEREPNPEMYDFLSEWFAFIDIGAHYDHKLHLKFLIEFSDFLGFNPLDNYSDQYQYFDMLDGRFCTYKTESEYILDETDSKNLYDLMHTRKEDLKQLNWPKDSRNRMNDQLIQYYKLHISGFRDLNSLEVLRSVL